MLVNCVCESRNSFATGQTTNRSIDRQWTFLSNQQHTYITRTYISLALLDLSVTVSGDALTSIAI